MRGKKINVQGKLEVISGVNRAAEDKGGGIGVLLGGRKQRDGYHKKDIPGGGGVMK